MEVILATTSTFKSDLLKGGHIFHKCLKSNFEEIDGDGDVYEIVKQNALGKAKSVSSALNSGFVIGVDTVVCFEGEILTKPESLEEAKEVLKMLSGKVNYVITGISLIDVYNKKEFSAYEETKVYFKDIPEEAIDYYIANEKWILDSSGYIIENILSSFVEKIEGNYNNILGMPISTIYNLLSSCGYKIGE